MWTSQITAIISCRGPHLQRMDETAGEARAISRISSHMRFLSPHKYRPNKSSRSRARLMPCSPFLNLPPELRLIIYEYALLEPSKLGVGGFHCHSSGKLPKILSAPGEATYPAVQPPLTRVSSQLRREALPLFYRLNCLMLAVHYRKAGREVDEFLNQSASTKAIRSNLWNVSIKHRFGILEFKGTIDFDMREFKILTELWFGSVPPMVAREIEKIMEGAGELRKEREEDGLLIAETLRALVEVLGVSAV